LNDHYIPCCFTGDAFGTDRLGSGNHLQVANGNDLGGDGKGPRASHRLNSRVVKHLIAGTLFYARGRTRTVTLCYTARALSIRRSSAGASTPPMIFSSTLFEICFGLIADVRCRRIDNERHRGADAVKDREQSGNRNKSTGNHVPEQRRKGIVMATLIYDEESNVRVIFPLTSITIHARRYGH